MKKVALVFVIAVLAPSLVLAWLAVRSLRDQQFLLERQQSQLDQRATDTLAQSISDYLAQQQQEFGAQVENLATDRDPRALAAQFDDELRRRWPLAEVGFCVTAAGKILSPQPNSRPDAQMFRLDNSSFLGNREPVEVYLAANNANSSANSQATGNNSSIGNSWGWTRNSEISPPAPPTQARASLVADAQKQLPVQTNALAKSTGSPAPSPVVASAAAPPLMAAFGSSGSSGGRGGGGENPTIASRQAITNDSHPEIAGLVPGNLQTDSSSRNATTDRAMDSQRNQANTLSFAINNSGANSFAPSGNSAASNKEMHRSQGYAPITNSTELSQAVQPKPQVSEPVATAASTKSGVAMAKDGGQPAATPKTSTQPAADSSPSDVVDAPNQAQQQSAFNYKAAQSRAVKPQSLAYLDSGKAMAKKGNEDLDENLSKVVPAEAEFRQLIGSQTDGMLARFLQDRLKLMCWHRLNSNPDLIFGVQLNLDRVIAGLRPLLQAHLLHSSYGDATRSPYDNEVALAVLDDKARPVVVSRPDFQANWKRPFVATEIGDALPHWEAAAYLTNPEYLTQAAHTARLTLGLLVAVLLTAIGIGSLLIVRNLNAELKLARQKTDFVSNVSHELKTPLTSIRMFSELLAEGRVADHAKQHSYLQIISAEAGRLTRLINNVLDFSRMERGEKKYNFQPCELTEIVRNTADTIRPHLEAGGYQLDCELPESPLPIRGDADGLSQIIVNLLSNAEKYSNGGKEILLCLASRPSTLPHAELRVMDRGPGVPKGSEQKIFEQFYRAHDSLSSGIQGSGLGLTIARQIARAHGGDVAYEPREGGGSNFVLRLPLPRA